MISYASAAATIRSPAKAAVGAILIVVILFMPEGVLGTLLDRRARRRWRAADMQRAAVARRRVELDASTARPRIGAALLTVDGVSRAFSGIQALRQVDSVGSRRGNRRAARSQRLGQVHAHQCRQRTLSCRRGSIDFDRHELTHLHPHQIARLGVARTYQIPRPFAHLTVLENVVLTAMFGGAALDRRRALLEAWRWLEFTGLADKSAGTARGSSICTSGNSSNSRARSRRAQSCCCSTRCLSGLTPTEIDSAVDLIRRIREHGTTIVLVEHVMRAVMALADRIIVLDQGQVIADGRPRGSHGAGSGRQRIPGGSADAAG